MKYEAQVNDLKKVLGEAKHILVVMPQQATPDHLAAGLSLYLSLMQSQKDVAIATDSTILVGHTHLFGVGQIQNKMPQSSGGNLVITLGGVAENGTAPALQRLDYSTAGNDLNLVFYVLPGQKFEPKFITPHYEGGFDVVIAVGAQNLQSLGNLYSQNQSSFEGIQIVNIDRDGANSQFGTVNIVDPETTSLSEMVGHLLYDSQMNVDQDVATNILNGIYTATDNLQNANADTFALIGESLKRGGQRPAPQQAPVQQQAAPVQSEPTIAPPQPAPLAPTPVTPAAAPSINQFFAPPQNYQGGPVVPPAQPAAPVSAPTPESQPVYNQTPEEAVSGEGVAGGEQIVTPEPDWLTPKVYRSGNIG